MIRCIFVTALLSLHGDRSFASGFVAHTGSLFSNTSQCSALPANQTSSSSLTPPTRVPELEVNLMCCDTSLIGAQRRQNCMGYLIILVQ